MAARPIVVGVPVRGQQPVQVAVAVANDVQAAPAAPSNPNEYRLNHQKLHITQASLGVDEISNEEMLAMLKRKGEIVEYSIGDEVHTSPSNPNRPRHKHAFVHYLQPINHRDSRYCQIFDMRGWGGRTLHPEIQSVGPKKVDRANVIYYTQKDKLYIASPHLKCYNQEATSASWAVQLHSAKSVHDGMHMLMERHPQVYYMHGDRIKRNLEMRLGEAEPSPFKLADFRITPLDVSKPVVLQGASHIGKTQFALAHFEHPLLVSEIDDLESISLRTDGIVFDQMSFTRNEEARLNLNADQTIRLLDMELSRSIFKRYHNVKIPRGMPRIFTTNRSMEHDSIFARGRSAAEQEGIDSRVRVMPWMDNDLRRNPGPNARGAQRA